MAYCVFCNIVAKKEPAKVRYEDDEVIAFDNYLDWAPIMILVIPKKHMTQEEMWSNLGRVGQIAVQLGKENCPNGFRLVSNLGHDAMQSQNHAHVHVLGGVFLGRYVL